MVYFMHRILKWGEGTLPSLRERLHTAMESTDTTTQADRTLDMGEKGCSHLLEDIAATIQEMSPGQTLLVIANDPAAPLDIKVWSRTSGNPLLKIDLTNNLFLLQRKSV
ncbi:sulfurtransferase TusA family protein [Ktedonobacteria bacterium brp13]|nr:sulfurtransferase TusA family protein [Ktedonobacteria bacterium brp13]